MHSFWLIHFNPTSLTSIYCLVNCAELPSGLSPLLPPFSQSSTSSAPFLCPLQFRHSFIIHFLLLSRIPQLFPHFLASLLAPPFYLSGLTAREGMGMFEQNRDVRFPSPLSTCLLLYLLFTYHLSLSLSLTDFD